MNRSESKERPARIQGASGPHNQSSSSSKGNVNGSSQDQDRAALPSRSQQETNGDSQQSGLRSNRSLNDQDRANLPSRQRQQNPSDCQQQSSQRTPKEQQRRSHPRDENNPSNELHAVRMDINGMLPTKPGSSNPLKDRNSSSPSSLEKQSPFSFDVKGIKKSVSNLHYGPSHSGTSRSGPSHPPKNLQQQQQQPRRASPSPLPPNSQQQRRPPPPPKSRHPSSSPSTRPTKAPNTTANNNLSCKNDGHLLPSAGQCKSRLCDCKIGCVKGECSRCLASMLADRLQLAMERERACGSAAGAGMGPKGAGYGMGGLGGQRVAVGGAGGIGIVGRGW